MLNQFSRTQFFMGESCPKNHCGRCCSHACGGAAALTDAEQELLELLAQYAFLPLAFDPASEEPVCLERTDRRREEISAALLSLGEKRLISMDYDMPLTNYDYSTYTQYECYGSIALTAFGQETLDQRNIT